MTKIKSLAGVVLAGGLARRLGGGDKGLTGIGGASILDRVVGVVRPQVGALALNANGDPARFAALGLPVLADSIDGFVGPLAGILAGMEWAATLPGVRWLLTVPTDTPFLPADLGQRLAAAIDQGAPAAIAASGGRRHPVIGLWPVALAAELRDFVVERGVRKVGIWTKAVGAVEVDWPVLLFDPFFNVNTAQDAAEAGRLAGE
jgi:molybdopterin-guanine dinucleotide biosynthesis protein A